MNTINNKNQIILTGAANYARWAYAIVAQLDKHDHWSETTQAPIHDKAAKSTLIESLSPEVLDRVLGEATAPGIWAILKREYAGDNPGRKLHLIKAMTQIKISSSHNETDVTKDFLKAAEILRDLEAAGGETKSIAFSELVSLCLIAALPAKYNNVRMKLETVFEDTSVAPDINAIKTIVTQENFTQAQQQGPSAMTINNLNCVHGRAKAICYTCDPSKKPTCVICKQKGKKLIHHHQGSKV